MVVDHERSTTTVPTIRANMPLLIYANNWKPEVLPTQMSLACVGQTIADNFKIQRPTIGTSLLK